MSTRGLAHVSQGSACVVIVVTDHQQLDPCLTDLSLTGRGACFQSSVELDDSQQSNDGDKDLSKDGSYAVLVGHAGHACACCATCKYVIKS